MVMKLVVVSVGNNRPLLCMCCFYVWLAHYSSHILAAASLPNGTGSENTVRSLLRAMEQSGRRFFIICR